MRSGLPFATHWIAARHGAVTVAALAAGLTGGCSGGFHRDVEPTQVYMLRASATHAQNMTDARDVSRAEPLPSMQNASKASNVPDAPDSQHSSAKPEDGNLANATQKASLRIGRTIAAPGLDSDRIILVQSDHKMNHFAASRWPAPLTEVIEALAVETLRGTGAFATVHDSRGAFPADYYLQIAIRRFEADYTESATPQVRVALDCTLGRRIDRERLASFMAEGNATASENRVGPVVGAFEKATQAALATLAQRSVQVLEVAALEAETSPAGDPSQKVDRPVDSMKR